MAEIFTSKLSAKFEIGELDFFRVKAGGRLFRDPELFGYQKELTHFGPSLSSPFLLPFVASKD